MSTTTIEQQIVVFALSAEEYALPIENVQEIIRYAEPRAVASPEPSIRGLISLRGKIVPVVDLALRLGLVAEPADEQKIVIVELDGGTVGVVVDDVEEVLTIDASQLDEVPGASSDAIDAIAKLGDRLVALLNPDRLLGGLGDTA
jgi:purine-binding chemotaxis protein CheW